MFKKSTIYSTWTSLPLVFKREDQDDSKAEHTSLLNVTDKNVWTPLQCAVEWGHESCVRLLCESGAELDIASISGKTALHRAIDK